MKKRRVLKGKSVPEYAAVEPQGKGLMVASEKPFVCTHVDGCPLEQPEPEPMEMEKTGGEMEKTGGLEVNIKSYLQIYMFSYNHHVHLPYFL